jgi:hypothetical protein
MTGEPMLVRLIVTAVGLALGASPWFTRRGSPEWQWNIPMSLASRVLVTVFGVAFALTAWIDGLFCPMATALILVGLSGLADRVRHQRSTAKKREEHAPLHPGTVDGPAPELVDGSLPSGDSLRLFDADTGRPVGRLDREQLLYLVERHREWGLGENDFFILPETIQVLEEAGAPDELLDFLSGALGDSDSVELRWVAGE